MQKRDLNREPPLGELFRENHTRKKDKSRWVDLRSKATYVRILNFLLFFIIILYTMITY